MNTRPCRTCEHHKSKGNKNPGVLIPNETGKCTHPEGLCEEGSPIAPGRPATTAPEILSPEITEEHGAQLMADANTAAVADQAILDAEEIHKALGQIEGLEFVRRVGDVAIAQIFQNIKKNKAYKNLPYIDADGNLRHVGDFKEFCQVKLGRSYTRCHELSQNLHTLGPDLYESAERIGFRARDYRALKALPEAEQEVVKQALESESKEQVLDLLQDMAERHAAEKKAAKKELKDIKADKDALDKLMADKTERLDKLSVELEKLKSLAPAERQRLALEREAAAAERLNTAEVKASATVNEFLGELADVLEADGISLTTSVYANGLAQSMAEGIGSMFANYGIAVDFEGIVRPEWTRAEAAQDLGVEAE